MFHVILRPSVLLYNDSTETIERNSKLSSLLLETKKKQNRNYNSDSKAQA
jgi:hypothetical protein